MLKCKLFVNFCYALYGCQLWDLGHNELKHFDTVWRIVVRRVWGLPPRIHSVFLPFMARVFLPLLYLVFIILLLIVCIAVILMSCLWHAMRMLFFKFPWKKFDPSANASSHVNLLCELVFCRSGYFHSVLSDAETEYMLRDVCCN